MTSPRRIALVAVPGLLSLIPLVVACSQQPKPNPFPPPPPPVVAPLPADKDDLAIAALINARRPSPHLPVDPRLNRAAQSHAEDMARRGYFSHTTPEGMTLRDRTGRVGWYDLAGEVIAYGAETPESALGLWLGSSGHRRVLTHTDATALGCGKAGLIRVVVVGLGPGWARSDDPDPDADVTPPVLFVPR